MAKKKGDIQSRLKKMQSSWEETEPSRGRINLPDDNYGVRINSAVLEESKSSGRLQIHWDMTVIDEGDFENVSVHKYDGIDTEENLPYVQGALEALELDIPDDLADIGETLEAAAGLEVDITVATKDEFTNIYFNELLQGAGEEGDDEADDDDAEEGTLEALTDEDDEDAFDEFEKEITKRCKQADIDPDDYADWKAAELAVREAEAVDDDDEDAEEEDAEEEYSPSEDDINGMKKKELLSLIEDNDIDIDTDDMSIAEIREAVIEEWFEE